VLEVKLGLIYWELISNIFEEIGPQLILRCFGRSDKPCQDLDMRGPSVLSDQNYCLHCTSKRHHHMPTTEPSVVSVSFCQLPTTISKVYTSRVSWTTQVEGQSTPFLSCSCMSECPHGYKSVRGRIQ